jgi:hypothetical protein
MVQWQFWQAALKSDFCMLCRHYDAASLVQAVSMPLGRSQCVQAVSLPRGRSSSETGRVGASWPQLVCVCCVVAYGRSQFGGLALRSAVRKRMLRQRGRRWRESPNSWKRVVAAFLTIADG